jgi:hypothetical protein
MVKKNHWAMYVSCIVNYARDGYTIMCLLEYFVLFTPLYSDIYTAMGNIFLGTSWNIFVKDIFTSVVALLKYELI